MRSPMLTIDCSPDEQKRLMVIAGVSTGSPPKSDAMRAMFSPCSPSGMAQPSTTSSTSLGSTCARATASLMTVAASVFRPRVLQRSLDGTPERRPHSSDDDDVFHGRVPLLLPVSKARTRIAPVQANSSSLFSLRSPRVRSGRAWAQTQDNWR